MASKSSPPSSSSSPASPTAQLLHAAVDSDEPAVVGLGPACAAAYAKLEVWNRENSERQKPLDLDLLDLLSSSLLTARKHRRPQSHFQQACLAESDRDWTACQQQVKELKECTLAAASNEKEKN